MFTSQNDVTMKGEGNFRLLQLLFVCLLGLCSSSKPHCLSDITLNDTAQLTVFSISAIILLNSQLTKYSVVFLTCCRSWSSQGESRDDDVLAVEKWLEVVFLTFLQPIRTDMGFVSCVYPCTLTCYSVPWTYHMKEQDKAITSPHIAANILYILLKKM